MPFLSYPSTAHVKLVVSGSKLELLSVPKHHVMKLCKGITYHYMEARFQIYFMHFTPRGSILQSVFVRAMVRAAEPLHILYEENV
jgi:hypothetical protein